ncbi:MAG: hypothetical protein ACP5F9_05455 [Thiomonas sp.]|jgi:hypothetical protein
MLSLRYVIAGAAVALGSFSAAQAAQNQGNNPPLTTSPTHTISTKPHQEKVKLPQWPSHGRPHLAPRPIEDRKVPPPKPTPDCGPTFPGRPNTSTC